MITISLKQLDASWNALQSLAQLNLTAKLSYRISRICTSAESHYKAMRESIQALFKKHDAEEHEGQWRITDPEKVKAFNEELAELMTEVVELWGDAFTIEQLGDVEIAPAVLMPLLDWLITEEGAEKAKASNA